MSRTVLVTATLAASLLASVAPALAQQKLSWDTHETEDGAALIYGVPDSEVADIFFLCTRGKDDITVQSMTGSKGLEKDKPARIILTAGKVKKTFDGKALEPDAKGVINVEAAGKLDDLKALVKGGSQLVIETKGVKKAVPLSGAADAAARFETACAAAK